MGACLANAFLLDLESKGLLNLPVDVKTILLDKSKIDRAKKGVKRTAFERHSAKNLICIGVDSKIDRDTYYMKRV